jgi:hypothetical protein
LPEQSIKSRLFSSPIKAARLCCFVSHEEREEREDYQEGGAAATSHPPICVRESLDKELRS